MIIIRGRILIMTIFSSLFYYTTVHNLYSLNHSPYLDFSVGSSGRHPSDLEPVVERTWLDVGGRAARTFDLHLDSSLHRAFVIHCLNIVTLSDQSSKQWGSNLAGNSSTSRRALRSQLASDHVLGIGRRHVIHTEFVLKYIGITFV